MTSVKICGITNKEDALCAAKCGAAALGFIFYPPSPRYIRPADVKKIVRFLPQQLVKIGVFVNEKAAKIKRAIEYCGLDMIQLHGDESPEFCREFPSAQVIKAVELKNEADFVYAKSYHVGAILVDSRHAGLYGGTGKSRSFFPADSMKKMLPKLLKWWLRQLWISTAAWSRNRAKKITKNWRGYLISSGVPMLSRTKYYF
jgi:phosphoribosylanthranilate isomerase